MIKILRRELQQKQDEIKTNEETKEGIIELEEPKIIYNFLEKQDDIKINITLFHKNQEVQREISINKSNNLGKVIELIAVSSMNKFELYTFSFLDLADANFKRNITTNSNDSQRVARLVFEPNGNIIIALHSHYGEIDGFENIIMNPDKLMTECICEISDFYKEKFEAYTNRYKLLQEVDVYKSVSYLEAQVDLLTKILLNIAGESELTSILKKADEYSVLNVKPLSDIEKEFVESKANFRKKQEDYYNLLHGE